MEELLTKLIEQVPLAVVGIIVLILVLKHLSRRDQQHNAVLSKITERHVKAMGDLTDRQFEVTDRNTKAFVDFKVQLASRRCLLNGNGADCGRVQDHVPVRRSGGGQQEKPR